MQPYRLFIISPIMSITGLHIVCVYTIHCISYKDCYKWSLDLDFPFAEITIIGSHMIKTSELHLRIASSDFTLETWQLFSFGRNLNIATRNN